MIDKIQASMAQAVAVIPDGASVLVGGFGEAGVPYELLHCLAERLRAAGAGLGPFYTPTGYGTELAEGRRQEIIDGIGYVLEQPLRADYALIRAHLGDRWGNLMYRHAARNFNPVMCMAAGHAIAQVDEIVPLGALAPEQIMTQGIFVKSVVRVEA